MSDQRHRDVRAGDTFEAPGGYVRVTRVGRAGWVDIAVSQPNGATWAKRMPDGIPIGWVVLARG